MFNYATMKHSEKNLPKLYTIIARSWAPELCCFIIIMYAENLDNVPHAS